MTPRRYSDQDVALILRRAVELEGTSDVEPDAGGVTLAELREIAREVGIDPAAVDRAAEEFDEILPPAERERASRSGVVRTDRRLAGSRTGVELRHLLARVDRSMLGVGSLEEQEGSVRWHAPGRFRSTTIALDSEGRETRISVAEQIGPMRGPILGMATSWAAVAGLLVGAVSGAGTALMMALVFGIAGFFLGGGIWQLTLDRSIQRTRLLARELESLAALTAPAPDPRRGGEAPGA